MSLPLLYLLLLKATLTTFSGIASLPSIHDDLVVRHHVLTDQQLGVALAAGRLGPGPTGVYVVSVGYLVAGLPGAVAGWVAMVTPAFLVMAVMRLLRGYLRHPRVEAATRAVSLASAGLIVYAALPLGRAAAQGPVTLLILATTVLALLRTRWESFWVFAGAAVVGALAGV